MKTSRRNFLLAATLGAIASRYSLAAPSAEATAIEVWKDPNCGCCGLWVNYLRKAGFAVTVIEKGNTAARARANIDMKYGSCHTAFVDGYAVEGHVPVREIRRLLKERPDAIGLAVPGMVIGSPGMEQGGQVDPYKVLLLLKDGSSKVYASYPA
jgi:hypothetical protein